MQRKFAWLLTTVGNRLIWLKSFEYEEHRVGGKRIHEFRLEDGYHAYATDKWIGMDYDGRDIIGRTWDIDT